MEKVEKYDETGTGSMVQNDDMGEDNAVQIEEEGVASSISQMDIDVENLKKLYTFIKPVNGEVSSLFGARQSEYQNVEGYHTGIDIATDKGTKLKSAFDGKVDLVSSKGDYRKTCKN